jgi:nitric oxide dioxygenase
MAELSQKTKDIVKSTAPVLKEQGVAITTRMYERMFRDFPHAKPLFKHQPDNQNQVLARAIISYCENIDNLANFEVALDKIARRHVETLIRPEHYPWVAESLLGAMKDVLGDAATDEIITAWGEAFWFWADILIEREKKLYAESFTEESRKIVKETAPVLKQHGEAITTRMYEIMFSEYPDAKALFKNAPNNQNQILARSILAYAENIDNLEALEGALDKIARHHLDTEVKPIHYPWVAESLLQAMKDVLGDAATDKVINAWFGAYWFLADILIEREKKLYGTA